MSVSTEIEIGIEAILIKPRIVFTTDDEFWGYDVPEPWLWDARNFFAIRGELSKYVVINVLLDVFSVAPEWVRQSGIFSFFGPGRAAIREAIETTMTAYLRDYIR